MILILSFSYYEQGTDPVIDWLLHYNVPFIKVSVEDLLNKKNDCCLDVNNGRLLVDGEDYTDKIKVIFFRRFYRYQNFENKENLGEISRKIFYESNQELEELANFLYLIFESKVWFPKPSRVQVNKLEINHIAHKLGIATTNSIVTNSRKVLSDFYTKSNKKVITKAINRLSYYTFGKYTYYAFTTKITENLLNTLPEYFFPTLFQEAIDADFEIRIFYIDGAFYPTAALSSNRNREIDIKQSFNKNELHWVPFLLPEEIKIKLHLLMKELDLITGSIDVILDKKGKYHFIEVNPVGQYLAPSFYSHYYIEKIIAEWLIKKNQ